MPSTRRVLILSLLVVSFAGASVAAQQIDPDVEIVEGKRGLKYQDLVVGEGEEAKNGKSATVHYTGWLTDGTKFDSSFDAGRPFTFPLGRGRVIAGWDQGVKGMQVSGKRKLIIPSSLGYGARGACAAIPPHADLIFDVELLGVE